MVDASNVSGDESFDDLPVVDVKRKGSIQGNAVCN